MAQNSKGTAKPRGKPFPKGVTGNPGGRPVKTIEELDLIAACKGKTQDALDVILSIMREGQGEKTRLSAAIAIIERGYGKPTQAIDQNITGDLTVHWPLPRGKLDD